MNQEFYQMCQERSRYWQKQYLRNRKKTRAFYKREFVILDGLIDFHVEVGQCLDALIPQQEKPFLQFALLRIHEKALKVAQESIILMENGSASGAMARWRTLYELSVVSCVLLKYPSLSKKYIAYEKIDYYKYERRLVEYRDKLKLDSEFTEFPEIKREYEEAKAEYGWTGKTDYEWAKNDDIKDLNLFGLAQNVGLDHLYAYVEESHKYNHPSMLYLLNDRGSRAPDDKVQTYLFSPFEMELPLQLVAISLADVNRSALSGYEKLPEVDKEKLNDCRITIDSFSEAIIESIKSRYPKREVPTNAD